MLKLLQKVNLGLKYFYRTGSCLVWVNPRRDQEKLMSEFLVEKRSDSDTWFFIDVAWR